MDKHMSRIMNLIVDEIRKQPTKELADNMLGLDAFNQGNTFDDYVKLVFKNAAMGYIGGGVLGGTIKTAKFFKDGRVDLINPEEFEEIAEIYDSIRLLHSNQNIDNSLAADFDAKLKEIMESLSTTVNSNLMSL